MARCEAFQLSAPGQTRHSLRTGVPYFGGDRRAFAITVNGQPLVPVELKGDQQDFVETHYSIPAALLAAAPAGMLTVGFAGEGKDVAGGVFGLRLIKAAP